MISVGARKYMAPLVAPPYEGAFVAADVPVERAWRMLADQDSPAYPVGTWQRLVGCVPRQKLEPWMAAGSPPKPWAPWLTAPRCMCTGTIRST